MVPSVPCHNSRIPPQLEKNHDVPPSSLDEALSHCSVSREIPHSLLKFETVLDTLDATQSSPIYRSHLTVTLKFKAQLNLCNFSPPYLDMRVDYLALSGKGSRPSRRTSGASRSHIETEWKPRGPCHIPKDIDFPVHSR